MSYLTVHITERNSVTNEVDTSMFIIYDENEKHFYLYGTRSYKRNIGYNGYTPFFYKYHYTDINSLCHFVNLVINNPSYIFTIEYNNINIPKNELYLVDYEYLYNKKNNNNEIVAFDKIKFDDFQLKNNLLNLFSIPSLDKM
jgi:hypothetical protein